MTDISSVKAHADPQPASVAFYGGPPPPAFANGSPALDGTIDEEESSTIKCICGFSEDDGNTVLCEKCDTWQHIVCYYESTHHVPDVHECSDCYPRPIDSKGAAEKQRQRRELHNTGERKGKPKTTTKSHKKRVKDPLGSVQPNGWAVHSNNELHYSSERKSGSPRDQPPPYKRPKTSHRTSGSVSTISQPPALAPGSRKRASSTMYNGQSPAKSPSSPDGPSADDYSPEFLNLYRQPEPPPTDSNSFTDIRVANDISSWLKDRNALSESTGGMEPAQVFQRIDKTIEEFESLAPTIVKQTDEDNNITVNGLHPQWQYLVVENFVPNGGYIGELKGRIGRREDYFSDPSNRWDLLRHPEPFVFFPPHLPIYIDTRREGTILRYTRRSCSPNMTMKILTQGAESGFHFCFIAQDDIQPGDELTVGWEIDSEIRQRLNNAVTNGDIRKEGFKKIEPWVAGVLANFGICACNPELKGRECLLDRARRPNSFYAEPLQPLKSTKAKRTKKSQISPLSTGHATNSRAGSEAYNRDCLEDENMDSRSTSGSHSKPGSRDITPMTHFSVDGDLRMSDRERRKIQQQERLFEQLEYDEQHKGRRLKRNSGGSTLNTPGFSSSKQLGHSEHSPSARNPREHSHGVARKTSGNSTKMNGFKTPKSKPVYVDTWTQTEDTDSTDAPTPVPPLMHTRVGPRSLGSLRWGVLQRAQETRLQRERIRSASVKSEAKSPALRDVSPSQPSPIAPPDSLDDSSAMDVSADQTAEQLVKDPPPAPADDVEMKDADEATALRPTSPKAEEMPDAPNPEPSLGTSHPPIQPPAPPWDAAAPTALSAQLPAVTTTISSPQKPVDLHLQLPQTTDLAHPPCNNSAVTPGSVSSITGAVVAQSPISVGPHPSPFSPSVTNAVNPGPARKKLSLSDYTSRRAKLAQTQTHPTVGNSTSPNPALPPTQSTSSPTLSNSSLPNQTSPPAKLAEPSPLLVVTEEPKPMQPIN
ncbi:uncharacterized protein BDR25DRAFT_87733 [Lindgomyces ingoldianus]|uniref:Uncharacterized protein n=1 Tax=Lindgomyces ingoldianus TaxID=673940 RepID=A0ACB6R9F8_9PLEO|nr:uncharacterized protein BDR25DRAFT_87733 [Lindgomyces ingoldianus]KAF2475680.1 hypothetical protein BDR25DRAFT_87733 [Lindgomyces ingoldianus]